VCVVELTECERTATAGMSPVLDEIYHISEVLECFTWIYALPGMIGVRLVELPIPAAADGKLPCFNHVMFRKLLTPEQFMEKDVTAPVDSGNKVPEHV
jgi:hypothetical protein